MVTSNRGREVAVVLAAEAVRKVLKELSADGAGTLDRSACEALTRRFDEALSVQPYRTDRLVDVGPFVTERSGERRSLVEMLVIEPGTDLNRMARLLLRTLEWQPVPEPAKRSGKIGKS